MASRVVSPGQTVRVKSTGLPRRPARAEAKQITAGLAARYWSPDAARLPWVASAYTR
jgi:hypothetical protein